MEYDETLKQSSILAMKYYVSKAFPPLVRKMALDTESLKTFKKVFIAHNNQYQPENNKPALPNQHASLKNL